MNCSSISLSSLCHIFSLATLVKKSLCKVRKDLGPIVELIVVLLALAKLCQVICEPLIHNHANTCSLMLH